MTIGDSCSTKPTPVNMFTRPSVVRAWLREANIRPNRLLGQNFLIDGNILHLLLESADVSSGDHVLEVGPGVGGLTAGLLDRGARVLAVEKDERLLPLLEMHLGAHAGFQLVAGDALSVVPDALARNHITKMIANLPYTPGTRILVDVATSERRPERIVVMVQDEVANRITATPGTSAFGMLSLWCRVFYDVRYIKRVGPNCFWPRPKVDSAIVLFDRLSDPLLPADGWFYFRALTKHLFQQRRKQMGHVLRMLHDEGVLGVNGVDFLTPDQQRLRPEAVPLDVWCRLSENMRMHEDKNTKDCGE